MAKPVVDHESARVVGEVLVTERAAEVSGRLAERMEGPRGGRLAVIHRALADVDLERLLAGPVEQVAYADQLGDKARALRSAAERDRDALVRRVMVRELDIGDPELIDAGVRYRAWQPDGAASTVVANAQAALRDDAWTQMHQLTPGILAELGSAADDVVGESVALVAKLPAGVVDDRSAFSSRAHAQAWGRLRELVIRFDTLHDAAEHFRMAGLAPSLSAFGEVNGVDTLGATPAAYLRYARPWKLPRDYRSVHPCRRLATAVASGAAPCLRGAREADRSYWERQRFEQNARVARSLNGRAGVA